MLVGRKYISAAVLPNREAQYGYLSFDANFSAFSLAESPPRDLQITAYKYWCAHAQCRSTVFRFWLQILFCSCVNETTLAPSRDHGRSLRRLGREGFGMFTRSKEQ